MGERGGVGGGNRRLKSGCRREAQPTARERAEGNGTLAESCSKASRTGDQLPQRPFLLETSSRPTRHTKNFRLSVSVTVSVPCSAPPKLNAQAPVRIEQTSRPLRRGPSSGEEEEVDFSRGAAGRGRTRRRGD